MQFEPQPFDFLNGCELAAGTHLRSQVGQKLGTLRVLNVGQGRLEQPPGVARNLLEHAEQLAQRTQTHVELFGHVRDQQLVFLECRLQLRAAGFFGCLLGIRIVQKLLLVGLVLLEFPNPLFLFRSIPASGIPNDVKQFVQTQGFGILGLNRRCERDCQHRRREQ